MFSSLCFAWIFEQLKISLLCCRIPVNIVDSNLLVLDSDKLKSKLFLINVSDKVCTWRCCLFVNCLDVNKSIYIT